MGVEGYAGWVDVFSLVSRELKTVLPKGLRNGLHRLRIKNDNFVKLQVLGLSLGVDFTFTLDNNHNNDNHNNNDNNDNDNNNPHLNFFKGTVLGVKEQGLGIRDKG